MSTADTISYKWVSADEFWPVFKQYREVIFGEDTTIYLPDDDAAENLSKRRALSDNLAQIAQFYLLAYCDTQVVGWSYGRQETRDTYYMVNSAVLPQWRRQGIYRHMMDRVIEKCVQAGFSHIYSRHHCSNNAVIIAKLHKGFMISGMEIVPVFGTLVRLSYFSTKENADIFCFRTGARKLAFDHAQCVIARTSEDKQTT
jgi:GNAT superfamily N-acetyltransferase